MPDTQGISIGDATLEFLANTTQLDQGIDKLNEKIESGVARSRSSILGLEDGFNSLGEDAGGAADAIEDAGERSTSSLREARGEAGLLGEAFGVHLPRHVRSFIAELPGVGEALQAAFSATAILFVLDAVVKLTEKVTDFVSTTFIYTQAMKDADAATASLNKVLLANEAEIAKLNNAYDAMTMSPLQLLTKQLDEVNQKIEDQQKAFRNAQDQLYGAKNGMVELTDAQKTMYENLVQSNASTMETLADQNRNLSTQIQKLYDDEAKKHSEMLKKELSDLDQYNEETKLKTMQTMDEIMDGVRSLSAGRPVLPELIGNVDDFKRYEDAARVLGITLKSGLVASLNAAKQALIDLQASGKALPSEVDEAKEKIKELQAQVDQFGNVTPKVNEFFKAFQQGGDQSKAAISGFGDAYGQAMGKAIAGEESLGAAMETATKQFITQIGMRALVQGMYYFAQGIADSIWAPQNAAVDFAAAAEFFAIGAVGVAAGSAIPGGSGASGAGGGFQGTGRSNPNSPIQTTGSTTQSVATSTNVQHFAGGAFVSAPTLAVIGDAIGAGSQPEAVLPLGDPSAMRQIAGAIAEHLGMFGGGASTHTHLNSFFGKLSNSDLKRLMRQINHAVNRGTGRLNSTSTGRVIRRSP